MPLVLAILHSSQGGLEKGGIQPVLASLWVLQAVYLSPSLDDDTTLQTSAENDLKVGLRISWPAWAQAEAVGSWERSRDRTMQRYLQVSSVSRQQQLTAGHRQGP